MLRAWVGEEIGNQLGSYCHSQLRANEGCGDETEREAKDAVGILDIKLP